MSEKTETNKGPAAPATPLDAYVLHRVDEFGDDNEAAKFFETSYGAIAKWRRTGQTTKRAGEIVFERFVRPEGTAEVPTGPIPLGPGIAEAPPAVEDVEFDVVEEEVHQDLVPIIRGGRIVGYTEVEPTDPTANAGLPVRGNGNAAAPMIEDPTGSGMNVPASGVRPAGAPFAVPPGQPLRHPGMAVAAPGPVAALPGGDPQIAAIVAAVCAALGKPLPGAAPPRPKNTVPLRTIVRPGEGPPQGAWNRPHTAPDRRDVYEPPAQPVAAPRKVVTRRR